MINSGLGTTETCFQTRSNDFKADSFYMFQQITVTYLVIQVFASVPASQNKQLIVAALRSKCGHYIFALWFLSSFFLLFSSPKLSVADWMSTILLQMVALVRIQNADLKCTARGSLEIQDAKIAKICHLGTIA